MRRGLAEEIAVLDGLDGFGAIPGYYDAGQQIDASAGGNYSGGSSWPGNLPLTPSNAGLASAEDDLATYYEKLNVIDASAGANYSGGSNWPGNLPLTPSNAGLADGDGYGMERYVGSSIGSLEGTAIPGYYDAGQVIDASAGANYSGGSSWPGNLPLTPSNAGLAGLSQVDGLDGLFDNVFQKRLFSNQIPVFQRLASRNKLIALKRAGLAARRRGDMRRASLYGNLINRIRMMRRNILARSGGARQAA